MAKGPACKWLCDRKHIKLPHEGLALGLSRGGGGARPGRRSWAGHCGREDPLSPQCWIHPQKVKGHFPQAVSQGDETPHLFLGLSFPTYIQ